MKSTGEAGTGIDIGKVVRGSSATPPYRYCCDDATAAAIVVDFGGCAKKTTCNYQKNSLLLASVELLGRRAGG